MSKTWKLSQIDTTKIKYGKLISYDSHSLKIELPWLVVKSIEKNKKEDYLKFGLSLKLKNSLEEITKAINYPIDKLKFKLNSNNSVTDVFYFDSEKILIEEPIVPDTLVGKKIKCIIHFIGFKGSDLIVKIEQVYFKETETQKEVLEIEDCSDLENYL